MDNHCDKCFRHFKTADSLKNHQAFHKRQEKGQVLKIKLPTKRKIDFGAQTMPEPIDDTMESKRLIIDETTKKVEKTNNPNQDQDQVQDTDNPKQDQAILERDQDTMVDNEMDTSVSVHVPLPFALSANRMKVFMSPVSLWLCPMCMAASSKKDCWMFKNSGRTYVTLSMCKQCVECNTEMQNSVSGKWKIYFENKAEELKRKGLTPINYF